MKKQNKNIRAVVAIIGIFLVLSVIAGIFMAVNQASADPPSSQGEDTSSQGSAENSSGTGSGESGAHGSGESTPKPSPNTPTKEPVHGKTPSPSQNNPTQATANEYRGVWISYLEYQEMDMTSRDGFVRDITAAFKNCADLGLNTVIVHVRPFGDALYKSSIYPQSHLLTGTQGGECGYDPLLEMVTIAHSMGLKIEAWVNPYRVQLSSKMPSSIAASNPAKDTSLTFNVNGGVYYNPALAKVQDLVVRGVEEIVSNYAVDGIHMDDYFYPTTDLSIDKANYDASGSTLSQENWRRENVNNLVKSIYAKIKSINPAATFGISPQGNNDNNYNSQYSDVKLWLSQPGYADYIMPQLYWGFNYLTKSGRADYQFTKLAQQWAGYPRADEVKLYIGLGAYRIGGGDGGSNDQSEWSSGTNLANMVSAARAIEGIGGCGLYRYDNLFKNSAQEVLAHSERANLKERYNN